MLAKLKADLTAAKAYVVVHWKQLVTAGVVGKYWAAIVATVVGLVHSL
jgi:hypothetical protein